MAFSRRRRVDPNQVHDYEDPILSGQEQESPPTPSSSPSPQPFPPQNPDKLPSMLEQVISLLNITIQSSTKLLSPALSNIIQKSLPSILQLIQQQTPIRIQRWMQILFISHSNLLHLLLHSNQGQTLSSNAINIGSQYMNLITSVNSRQVMIDTMSFMIKCLNVLHSTEMKELITFLPILTIRFIDTLSSGEAKLFYHSISTVVTSMIEFVNQEDMTVFIAEVTARFVHALEMEHYHYSPRIQRYHKRRKSVIVAGAGGRKMMMMRMKMKRRNKKMAGGTGNNGGGTSSTTTASARVPSYGVNSPNRHAAAKAKKRRERNQYMNQTYNKRVLLRDYETDNDVDENGAGTNGNDNGYCGGNDNDIHASRPIAYNEDRQVEDAILSTLSQDHTTYSANEWITGLGRRTGNNDHGKSNDNDNDYDDIASLPSKVVLEKKINNGNGNGNGNINDNSQYSFDSSIHLDDLDDINTSDLGGAEDQDNYDDDDDLTDVVDTSYLRSGIKRKDAKRTIKEDFKYTSDDDDIVDNESTISVDDNNDNDTTSESLNLDIEDLVWNDADHAIKKNGNNQQKNDKKQKKRKGNKKKTLILTQEDSSIDDNLKDKITNGNNKNGKNNKKMKKSNRHRSKYHIRGAESSVNHFYRTLDDIATKIRNKTITETLKDGFGDVGQEKGLNTKKGAKWYPNAAAAAGAGNECGQDTLESYLYPDLGKPTRFRANIGVGKGKIQESSHVEVGKETSNWKTLLQLILAQLTTTQKIVIMMIILAYILICMVWFTFGCYGIYKWFTITSSNSIPTTPVLNEYVIKIIQEDLPKKDLMDTVIKAIEDTATTGETNFAENIAASLIDKEL